MIRNNELHLRQMIETRVRRLLRSMQAKRWQWAAGLLICAALYGYVGLRLWRDWRGLDLSVFQLHYLPLGMSLLVQGAGTLLAIWTWMLLLRQMGYPIPFKRHIRVYTTTNLARRLPGFVWWVVGRAYMYDRDGVSKLETSAGSALEMILGAAAAAAVSAVMLLTTSLGDHQVNSVVVIAMLVALMSLLHPRLFSWLRARLGLSSAIPMIGWGHLLFWLVCQMMVIVTGGLALYWMLVAIYPIPTTAVFGAILGWSLTILSGSILFWLPIDFGISGAVMLLILSSFLPTPVALVVVVAWRCWVIICELIWGVCGLLMR